MTPLSILYMTGWLICGFTFLITLLSKPAEEFEKKMIKYGLWLPIISLFIIACAGVFLNTLFYAFPLFFLAFVVGLVVWLYCQCAEPNLNYLYGYLVIVANINLAFFCLNI